MGCRLAKIRLTSRGKRFATRSMRRGDRQERLPPCGQSQRSRALPEMEKLIRDLLDCDLPYCCPHGGSTMIQISLAELEKKFGRKI